MGDQSRHLFVSPHLDDAVFACGEWIASSERPLVVTIFAGSPPADAPLTTWDRECGFAESDDVMAQRRDEDRAALDSLGAAAIRLDFRDDQYGEPRADRHITDALAALVAHQAPSAIHAPLGLFHSDHRRSSDASLALFDRFAELAWHVYEDAIYRCIPGAVDERKRALTARRFVLARHLPAIARDAAVRKRRAVACYRSQLRALRTRSAHDDVFAPERHWVLSRAVDCDDRR
jgi:LmbE family N-acetylglucosaminyl deacetylase